jgi:hypothetical protein
MGDRIWKCARLKVLIGEIYRLGLGVWDKRCLKQRVNHPKMDTSVPGHRVTAVISVFKDFKFNIVINVGYGRKVNCLALPLLAFADLLIDVCHTV